MIKRILVPLDGSRFGSRALKYAREISQKFGAEVVLLQVVQPATPMPATSSIAPDLASPAATRIAVKIAMDEDKRNVAEAKKYLGRKAREMESGATEISSQVIIGDPAQAIMKAARKERADLIVMTTHGKSGIRRAILGSVADEVIRNSRKPVLVIRPQTSGKK
jgi:nucleotide-binding universal stress UspA family protein